MKSINEINEFFTQNGYTMEQAISGYYYCVRIDEDGTTTTVWVDSACEDAYDLESATFMAYDIVCDIVYSVVIRSSEVSNEEQSSIETLYSGMNYSEAQALYDQKASELDKMAEHERCDLELTLYQGEEDDICQDELFIDCATFVGEKTDGKVAMVIKPKYYYTPYQIVEGDGKTERDFMEHERDGIKVQLIDASELTKEAMLSFGFPEWFANEPMCDSDFR